MKHLPQLDGLRAVALLMVFLHHAWAVPFGWSGVDLFFILSGYLITGILLRDTARMRFGPLLGHFFLRRAQRILPAYLVCLLLIAALTTQPWGALWPFYAFFLQNLPVAFHWIPMGPLVPLWSLAVEQHFYLLWPLVVFFVPRRWLAPAMLAILVLVPILRWFATPLFPTSEAIYALTPFRIDALAAGALAALTLPRLRPAGIQSTIRAAQVTLLAAALTLALLHHHHPWFVRAANTPVFNCFAYSLNILLLGSFFVWAVLAGEHGWLYTCLAWKPLRALGRVSYSFYLLHVLVLLQVARFLHSPAVPFVAFAVTWLLATLSWYAVERPILNLNRTPSRPPRPAAEPLRTH